MLGETVALLDGAKLEQVFGVRLPEWRQPLGPIVEKLMTMDAPP